MKLNLSHSVLAETSVAPGALELFAIGDFGSATEAQFATARGMARYANSLNRKADGILFLGDNFYGPMPGGAKSERWKTGFSDPYPADVFPGPCWAVLGNHDYHDTAGNEMAQLNYAASLDRKTRWTMPAKYYRVDLPADRPQITFLMIDTNHEAINRHVHSDADMSDPFWMSAEEQAAQSIWLDQQLNSARAPFTVVVGHHPIYSEGSHGDTPSLVSGLAPILEKHGVHIYICGHDHDLQHLELDGLKTSFVVSGGGGARIYKQKEVLRKDSMVKDVHGFTHISLNEDRLHLRHIDPNGKIVHAFSKGVNHDWKVEA